MARRRFFKRSKSQDPAVTPESAPDEQAEPPPANPRQRKRKQSMWYNRLALLLLLLTPVVLACYLLIFLIPTLPLNPFPPYAQAMATFAPTPTPQPTYTRTPTPTSTATPTNTPRPTSTPTRYGDAASHAQSQDHGHAARFPTRHAHVYADGNAHCRRDEIALQLHGRGVVSARASCMAPTGQALRD